MPKVILSNAFSHGFPISNDRNSVLCGTMCFIRLLRPFFKMLIIVFVTRDLWNPIHLHFSSSVVKSWTDAKFSVLSNLKIYKYIKNNVQDDFKVG